MTMVKTEDPAVYNVRSKKSSGLKTSKENAVPKQKGLVIVITGNGKGKTTSAFGQALRAIGQGYKVFVLQFMKGRKYGEFIAAEKYLSNITIKMSGLDSFVMPIIPRPSILTWPEKDWISPARPL
jgi:cob(I)alamin adenosyltransferase